MLSIAASLIHEGKGCCTCRIRRGAGWSGIYRLRSPGESEVLVMDFGPLAGYASPAHPTRGVSELF